MNSNKRYVFLKRARLDFSVWAVIAAALIFLTLFSVLSLRSTKDQSRQMISFLYSKAEMIMWGVESSARTMHKSRLGTFIPQPWLAEIAQQPDVAYIALVDASGHILAHSQAGQAGKNLYSAEQIEKLSVGTEAQWRKIIAPSAHTFEVYKLFTPLSITGHQKYKRPGPHKHRPNNQANHFRHRHPTQATNNKLPSQQTGSLMLFIGLDLKPYEESLHTEQIETVISTLLISLSGAAGLLSLSLVQKYRQSRQLLQDTRLFAAVLINNIPLALVATDAQGHILWHNQYLSAVLKIHNPPLTGQALAACPGLDWESLMRQLDQQTVLLEKKLILEHASTTIPLILYGSKILDENKKNRGYLFMLRDISEMQALEKQVQRSERLSALGNLAAGVAHEIRNPLSSIKGIATYLTAKFTANDHGHDMSQLLIQEVDRLNNVVAELLAFAKPQKLRRTESKIEVIFERVLALAKHDAKAKAVILCQAIAPDTPSYILDKERVTQVLLNLLLNAIQASPPGTRVILSAHTSRGKNEKQPSELIIQIRDQGCGMDENTLQQIFTPYFSTKDSGVGLGLCICSAIIEKHAGDIDVQSKKGQGSIFTIHLPVPPVDT